MSETPQTDSSLSQPRHQDRTDSSLSQLRHQNRTDSVQEKLHLFQAAYAAGNYDLAMSLSESIKDTITFERQMRGILEQPQLGAGNSSRTCERGASAVRFTHNSLNRKK